MAQVIELVITNQLHLLQALPVDLHKDLALQSADHLHCIAAHNGKPVAATQIILAGFGAPHHIQVDHSSNLLLWHQRVGGKVL